MSKKALRGLIGILIAVIIAAGVCCAGFASRNAEGQWFGNGDLSSWHWSDKLPDGDDAISAKMPECRLTSATDAGAMTRSGKTGDFIVNEIRFCVLPNYMGDGYDVSISRASLSEAIIIDSDKTALSYSFLYASEYEATTVKQVTVEPTDEYIAYCAARGIDVSTVKSTYTYTSEEDFSGSDREIFGKLQATFLLSDGFSGRMLKFSFYNIESDAPVYLDEIDIFVTLKNKVPVVTLPEAPEKEGYTFVGWYYDEELTNPYIDGTPITEDTQLYAKFQINSCNVIFDAAGGDEINSITVDYGTVIEPVTPRKTGHDFLGWYYEDGTQYTGQAITDNTVLTAHWQVQKFTVTFYVGGEVYITKEVDYGTLFKTVIEDAKASNLMVLSVMTEEGEQPLEAFADTVITSDYNLNAEEKESFLQKCPWIFAVAGGVLAVVVIGYFVSAGKKKR